MFNPWKKKNLAEYEKKKLFGSFEWISIRWIRVNCCWPVLWFLGIIETKHIQRDARESFAIIQFTYWILYAKSDCTLYITHLAFLTPNYMILFWFWVLHSVQRSTIWMDGIWLNFTCSFRFELNCIIIASIERWRCQINRSCSTHSNGYSTNIAY